MEFRDVKPGGIFNVKDHTYARLHKPYGNKDRGGCCKAVYQPVWNATNFTNSVHFCPDTEVEGTRFKMEKED